MWFIMMPISILRTRFGLAAAGSISDFSGNEPSAQRLKEVRDKLKSVKAVCVFREPQFSDKAAKTVIEGTSARDGVLDPIGSGLPPGKEAYGLLLRGLAKNLKDPASPDSASLSCRIPGSLLGRFGKVWNAAAALAWIFCSWRLRSAAATRIPMSGRRCAPA